jgi:NTP pyrophosphatase (non-canonical NTP hydrolase)
MKDYLAQAALTAPKSMHEAKAPRLDLLCILEEIIDQGNALDILKKSLFYGKDYPGEGFGSDASCLGLGASLGKHLTPLAQVEVVHGIIGAITEAVELGEALVESISTGTPIDMVNLSEECGDVIWYLACILRHTEKDFPGLMVQNIAKLRKRYPDGFTEYDALNRNLSWERQVLEATQAAPAAKPLVELREAHLFHDIREDGARMRLAGLASGHPTLGNGDVTTSRVIKFDYETGIYETRNSQYKVINWATR